MLTVRDLNLRSDVQEYYAIEGNYFSLISLGSFVGDLLVETENGDKMQLPVGSEVEVKPFKNLILTQKSGADLIIRVAVSNGGEKYKTNSVFGTVKVVNGEVDTVKNRLAYMGLSYCPQVAATHSHCQIYNPVGSGKQLIVNKMTAYMSAAGAIGIARSLVANQLVSVSTYQGINKNVASLTNPEAVLRIEQSAAPIPILLNTMGNINVQAGSTIEVPLIEPILLSEGAGLIAFSGVFNVNLAVNFQWIELDV